jgi:hypothetical protein
MLPRGFLVLIAPRNPAKEAEQRAGGVLFTHCVSGYYSSKIVCCGKVFVIGMPVYY